ncbi:FecR family protein [Arcobacter sp.]|uniref:FecR family protein n=1 Tax=Arcobacter sp. TaxID=1872629 RepID=UPI003D0AE52D
MKKILLLLLFINLYIYANVAKVVALKGDAYIIRGKQEIKLDLLTKILKDDIVKTKDNSKIQIIFTDNTIITIGKNSQLAISDYVFDEKNNQYKADFGLLKGTFRTITGKIGKISPDRFKLNSKSSTIGIRGTQIISNVQIDGDIIYCTEGQIEIISKITGEKIVLKAGEFIKLKKGEKLEKQEFNAKIIKNDDEATKFKLEEDKPEEEPKKPETNPETNPTDPIEPNEPQYHDPDNPSVTTTTPVNLSGTTVMYDITGDYFNSLITGTYSEKKLAYDDSGNVINLNLDDIDTKYTVGGSYSSSLSSAGTQSLYNATNISFSSGTYTSIANTASGFDTNDDIQWGSWNATFIDHNNSNATFNLNGLWLVGSQTPEAEVQALINNNTVATYNGYVLAHNTTGTNYNASNSSIALTINFGCSCVTGTFNFDGTSVNVSGSSVTSSGFSFNNVSGGGSAWGSGNGKFYGTNASSVGGDFKIGFMTDNVIGGVFKGKR